MTIKRISIVFIFTMFFCIIATNLMATSTNAKFVPGELLIKPMDRISGDQVKAICANHGAYIVKDLHQIGVKLIRMPEHALETVMAALENNPNIEFVEHNFIAEGAIIPNDPNYSSQWHLPKISAPTGWDINIGSTEIVIAIIDSGVDSDHPDLMDKLIPGYNFLSGYDSSNTNDVYGHGTAVAGSAATITNNDIGVAGVAWENLIMPLVVLNSNNQATYADIIDAINYAADHDADIINISIGGVGSSLSEEAAINYAWGKGAIIIACAMNWNTDVPQYPAAYDNVMAISATTSSDTKSDFSSYGDWITVAAPGTAILTTSRDGTYGFWNGTSFASPITAGLAALILSVDPNLTNAQIVELIKQNADDLGTPGFDIYFGHGRINVYESLLAAGRVIPDPDITVPSVSITSPSEGEIVSGTITVITEVTDNITVAKVDLYVGGSIMGTKTAEPYDFVLDTTELTEGYNELIAEAYDTSGNIGYSTDIMINVDNIPEGDMTPPVVTFVSPEDGVSITKSSKVEIIASDETGVTGMTLYLDGNIVKVSKRSTIKYIVMAKKISAGEHELLAEAYDAAGNVGETSIIINNL